MKKYDLIDPSIGLCNVHPSYAYLNYHLPGQNVGALNFIKFLKLCLEV